MKLSGELPYQGIDIDKLLLQMEAWDWTIWQRPKLTIITTTPWNYSNLPPHKYLNVNVPFKSLD